MQNASRNWIEADVHSWSTRMSQVLNINMPGLVKESEDANNRCDPSKIKGSLNQNVWFVIDKITGRRIMKDSDLCKVNPLGLLQLVWEEIPKEKDDLSALEGLLRDIGGTCLQGDTHRLFSYLVAMRRSKQ